MNGVASSAIDDRRVGDVLSVMYEYCPEVDENEKGHIGKFLQREYEGKDVVWDTLREPIERVEGMRCIWCRHDPLMMRLMQCLVDHWVV